MGTCSSWKEKEIYSSTLPFKRYFLAGEEDTPLTTEIPLRNELLRYFEVESNPFLLSASIVQDMTLEAGKEIAGKVRKIFLCWALHFQRHKTIWPNWCKSGGWKLRASETEPASTLKATAVRDLIPTKGGKTKSRFLMEDGMGPGPWKLAVTSFKGISSR